MTNEIKGMTERLKESAKEKTVNFWARLILRILAGGVLTVYSIFRLIVPVALGRRVEIDVTDSRVMVACIVILLSVEVALAIFNKYVKTGK